jgi:hypothetical protein
MLLPKKPYELYQLGDRQIHLFENYRDFPNGAVDGTRTCDLRFTKALLYQLSYNGEKMPAICGDYGAFF